MRFLHALIVTGLLVVLSACSTGSLPRRASIVYPELTAEQSSDITFHALGLVGTKLVEPGHLTWPQAIEKMTINPARVLGLKKGTLAIGAEADVTIIDPDRVWNVDAKKFASKSSNSPFSGWSLKGRADTVLVGGRVKYRAEN